MVIRKGRECNNINNSNATGAGVGMLFQDSSATDFFQAAITRAQQDMEIARASIKIIQELREELSTIQNMLMEIIMAATSSIEHLGSRLQAAEATRQTIERSNKMTELAFHESAAAISSSPFSQFLSQPQHTTDPKDVPAAKAEDSRLKSLVTMMRLGRRHMRQAQAGSRRILAAVKSLDFSACILGLWEQEAEPHMELARYEAMHGRLQLARMC